MEIKEFSRELKKFYNGIPIVYLDWLVQKGNVPGYIVKNGMITGQEKQ